MPIATKGWDQGPRAEGSVLFSSGFEETRFYFRKTRFESSRIDSRGSVNRREWLPDVDWGFGERVRLLRNRPLLGRSHEVLETQVLDYTEVGSLVLLSSGFEETAVLVQQQQQATQAYRFKTNAMRWRIFVSSQPGIWSAAVSIAPAKRKSTTSSQVLGARP